MDTARLRYTAKVIDNTSPEGVFALHRTTPNRSRSATTCGGYRSQATRPLNDPLTPGNDRPETREIRLARPRQPFRSRRPPLRTWRHAKSAYSLLPVKTEEIWRRRRSIPVDRRQGFAVDLGIGTRNTPVERLPLGLQTVEDARWGPGGGRDGPHQRPRYCEHEALSHASSAFGRIAASSRQAAAPGGLTHSRSTSPV
jgi:hypothetical protein